MLRRALASASASLQPLCWKVQPAFAYNVVRGLKETTGIVGLPVDPNARDNLKIKLREVLEAVTIIPEDAEYRKVVEKTIKHRLAAADSDMSDEALEEQFDAQLEQQIKMLEGELQLIPKMAEWKPWEVPDGYTVPCVEEQDVDAHLGELAKKQS